MQNLAAVGGAQIATGLILLAAGIVTFILLYALGIVWVLKKLGGRFNANVQAKMQRWGSSFFIAATGIIGTYLIVVAFQFTGLYFILWMIRKLL